MLLGKEGREARDGVSTGFGTGKGSECAHGDAVSRLRDVTDREERAVRRNVSKLVVL